MVADEEEEYKGLSTNRAPHVFSMERYQENQTFKTLREEDPDAYQLQRNIMLDELQLLLSQLERVKHDKGSKNKNRLLRRVWVVRGVLDYDLNLSLLEKVS